MKRARRRRPPLLSLLLTLGVAVLSVALAPACSEDGVTPDCPAVPLYDIGAAGERNAAEDERLKAVDAGCLTDIDTTVPPP